MVQASEIDVTLYPTAQSAPFAVLELFLLSLGYPRVSGYCEPPEQGYGFEFLNEFDEYTKPSSYGLSAYGLTSYGSFGFSAIPVIPDTTDPTITSVVSLNGFEVEVYFSELMLEDSVLLDPLNYQLIPVNGANSSVVSVRVGQVETWRPGVVTVILTHSGTTLGSSYQIDAQNITDLADNVIDTTTPVYFYAKGEAPTYTVTAVSGNQLLFEFSHPILADGGLAATDAITFTSDPNYPVTLQLTDIEHPYQSSLSKALLTVDGMTSLSYTSNISSSTAIEYSGSYLPDASTTFNGVELDETNGHSAINSGLFSMNRDVKNAPYGWAFLDTSGLIDTDSTFRMDCTFGAKYTIFSPVLDSFVTSNPVQFIFEDGAAGTGTRVTISLLYVSGTYRVRVQSGAYDAFFDRDWRENTTHTLSMIRNRKSGLYVILFDDAPVLSTLIANFTDPALGISPGISIVLPGENYRVTNLSISYVSLTATNTVSSAAWNFFHNVTGTFIGSDENTRSSFHTQHGPLVKAWGDATPATAKDVTVKVNDTPVVVSLINPYTGSILLDTPVPLSNNINVSVDYKWMDTPTLPLVGLNTPGLVLNQWDRASGHHDPAYHGSQIQDETHPKGAVPTSRFPMRVVLGPHTTNAQPLQIGWRYLGIEKEYSAVLNSSNSLLLNQSPFATAQEGMDRYIQGKSVAYEGTALPASDGWLLSGNDSGSLLAGTYILIDNSYTVAYYSQEVDTTFESIININTRFKINSYTLEGVFSGVGFGVHDNKKLYYVGALLVNGLEHVGMLTNPRYPGELSSWDIGPKVSAEILSSSTIRVPNADIPTNLVSGNRFQILAGNQTGVYTITSLVRECTGYSTLTVSPSFLADFHNYGNNYPDILFETKWSSNLTSYRLIVEPHTQKSTLILSGASNVTALERIKQDGYPSPVELDTLDVSKKGQIFWGSLSESAFNNTTWSFFRYGVIPFNSYEQGRSFLVYNTFDVLPENEDTYTWGLSSPYGLSYINTTTESVVLKSVYESYGYSRIEPLFKTDVKVDLTTEFNVSYGVLGAGDGEVVLNDGVKEIRLGTILYSESNDPDAFPYRQLVSMPAITYTGKQSPTDLGWELTSSSTGTWERVNADLVLSGVVQFIKSLDTQNDSYRRMMEIMVSTASECEIYGGLGNTYLGLTLSPNYVNVVDNTGAVVQAYPFQWNDANFHAYRLVSTTTSLSLFIDDVLQSPVLNISVFPASTPVNQCVFGTEVSAKVRHIFYADMPDDTLVKRTIGLWKGGAKTDIDSWELPRTDSFLINNSEYGSAIQEMDWRQRMTVRILRSPDWGVTVYRPDLPLPPYYNPESDMPGSGFITSTIEPSAGWINLLSNQLPTVGSHFGFVTFGSNSPVSIQNWYMIRYRLFKPTSDNPIAHSGMVLNRVNVISSGEITQDQSYESLEIAVLNTRQVSLRPTNINASTIYKVIDGDVIYTANEFTFDRTLQLVTLGKDGDGNDLYFSNESAIVLVTFIPGLPVTPTYLRTQPFEESVTRLYENTPPVPKSQTGESTKEVEYGFSLNSGALNSLNYVLNDPYKVLIEKDDANALYDCLTFTTVENGGSSGLIAIAEDTVSEYALSGTKVWQKVGAYKDNTLNVFPGGILFASGGSYQSQTGTDNGVYTGMFVAGGGNVNSAALYPTMPNNAGPYDGAAGPQSFYMRLAFTEEYTGIDDQVTEFTLEE
jgi:hypothetical protein